MINLQDIPEKNVEYTYDKDNKCFVLMMTHTGINHRFAQKFFHKPKVSKLRIQGLGNDVREAIDGKNSVEEIGIILKNKYGEAAEPVYERLLTFMDNLKSNKFIKIKKREVL